MGSKSKKRGKGRTAFDPVAVIKHSLGRGDYRQALKDARTWYRQSPTPELRCFLEHAYMGRAQQLVRNGLQDDARRILDELLQLGVTETAVEEGLPDLLVSVGMLDRLLARQDRLTEEDRTRLNAKAADQAVIRPDDTPASMKELRLEAAPVRRALEAVERGDDGAAMAELKEIARQSLFADWKYFVRGLIAYYRKDRPEIDANWDRLDPQRAAAGIAEVLRAMAGLGSSQADERLRAKIALLERSSFGQGVLSTLMQLRQAVADRDWRRVVKIFRGAHQSLRELEGDGYARLVECLAGCLARDARLDELALLSKIAVPPPMDPHWNRAKAIASENAEYVDEMPEKHWRNYVEDLAGLAALPVAQVKLAQALVWVRLAQGELHQADRYRHCGCGADHAEEIEEAEQAAEEAFEASRAVVPEHAPAYVLAAEYHEHHERPKEAAEAYRRLLQHVPDHLEALIRLAGHHIMYGGGSMAVHYALRARQLRPLDPEVAAVLWSAYLVHARELAVAGSYDEARSAFENADTVLPARAAEYSILARKAVLEIKVGDEGAAKRLVEQALDKLEEPTVLWLAMAIEGPRYELKLQDVWFYEQRWRESLRRRCRAATAGDMCRLLYAHQLMPNARPELKKYAGEVEAYLKRCSRLKWTSAEDLRAICEFLMGRDADSLLKRFVTKAVRQFPQVGYFHFLVGVEEMRKGPFRFNQRRAIEAFQRCIERVSNSKDPRDREILALAQSALVAAETVPEDAGEFLGEDTIGDVMADGLLEGLSPREVRKMMDRACAEVGLDVDAMLDELMGAKRR